jgi:broad specificity phosphatase PhoE
MRLIIVRHGETEENVKQILQGHIAGKLTKKGMDSAKKLASLLRKEKIDLILSSDLERAIYTTKVVAKFHKVPVHYHKNLRERSYGIFDGTGGHSLEEAEKASGLSRDEFRPPKGESRIDMRNRVKKLMDRFYEKYKDKTILVSTHGGVIRCLASIYLRVPLDQTLKMKTTNSGILIIDVKGKTGKLIKDTMFW